LSKKILIFEKNEKARNVIEIMCRKIGCKNVAHVDDLRGFYAELGNNVDTASGLSAFIGKKALPALSLGLMIVDWDTPEGGAALLMKDVKSKYSGNYRFIVVADSGHESKLGAAIKAGAYDVLVKPFTQAEFREKVTNALSGKEQMIVQSFNFSAASDKAKEKGTGVVNPFAVPKEKKPKPPFPVPKTAPPPVKKGDRVSFHGRGSGPVKSETVTATLVDGVIDGLYFEQVNIIGGGETCYWAKETDDGKVRLFYVNAKGENKNVEAKVVERDLFMHTFYLCEEYGCQILKNIGKWPPPGKP